MSKQRKLVDVSLFDSISTPLTYHLPDHLADSNLLGFRAIVPLAKRKHLGIITSTEASFDQATRAIDSIPDLEPVVSPNELELCRFISQYYCAALGDTLKAILPQPLTSRLSQRILITNKAELQESAGLGNELAAFLLSKSRGRSIVAAHHLQSFKRSLIVGLVSTGAIEIDWNVQSSKLPEDEYLVEEAPYSDHQITLTPEETDAIEYLREWKVADLQTWRKEHKFTKKRVEELVAAGAIRIFQKPPFLEPRKEGIREFIPNSSQQVAIASLVSAVSEGAFRPFLLHGVTASGKTEVYIATIIAAIETGRQAVILVPEIGLAQAIYLRLETIFGNKLGLIHSRLTPRSRYDIWHRARTGKLQIVMGPRSALFTPFPNLGIIVVDEEHDAAYKQESPAPRYHARDLAVYRARQLGAVVVLGSATPSIESYHNVLSGKYTLLELPERVDGRSLPSVEIVDLKKSFEKKGQGYLSEELVAGINDAISQNGQVMLLLNRRGFSPSVHCFKCGNKLNCKNCAVSLVFHKGKNRLLCHLCGYNEKYPDRCPSCNSNLFLYRGIGTEKFEEELRRRLPEIPLLRMDLDSTRRQGSFHEIYHKFKSGEAKILLGTQMIAKGFDFPDVALVGVITPDTSLELPDFRARERTFQLLTQVSGRAGRLNFPGRVILQTLHPEDATITMAATHDFRKFYEIEVAERDFLRFPPFSHLILIGIESKDASIAQKSAITVADLLLGELKNLCTLQGPIPAPIMKVKEVFRFHIMLKTKRVRQTSVKLTELLGSAKFKLSTKVHVIVDVDPVDMM